MTFLDTCSIQEGSPIGVLSKSGERVVRAYPLELSQHCNVPVTTFVIPHPYTTDDESNRVQPRVALPAP